MPNTNTAWERFMAGEISLHEMHEQYEQQPVDAAAVDQDHWKFILAKHIMNMPLYMMLFLLAYAVFAGLHIGV